MSAPIEERLLKHNQNRSVRIESRVDAGRRVDEVVKQFHSPRFPRRLFDRWRARREHRLLTRLRELGLPVPAPVGVRRSGGRWELVTELLEGTVPLRDVLSGDAPWPVPAERCARSLGQLFARVVEARIEHDDPHSGNVLIDSEGAPWLVDVGHARTERGFHSGRVEAALVRIASDVRERVSHRFRMRFLLAFRAALPKELRANLPEPRSLAADIEAAARERRRRVIERARLRWTRPSSAVRPYRSGGSGFLRSELHVDLPEELAAALDTAELSSADHSPHAQLSVRALRGRAVVAFVDEGWPVLRERWYRAARLTMHGVPCAQPVCLARSPHAFAAFELPAGVRFESGDLPRRRVARGLGASFGALHDRGLTARNLHSGDVAFTADGSAYLCPGAPLATLATGERAEVWRALAAFVDSPSAAERAAFSAAYVRAHRGGPREGRELREVLKRG